MDVVAQITALAGAISAMAGFIVYLFKDALSRADNATKVWQEQADEWQKVAETNAQSNRDLTALLTQALAALQRIETGLKSSPPESRK